MKKFFLFIVVSSVVQLSIGQNPQWLVFDTSNTIMLSNYISDISIDNNNNKWISSNLGLSKFDNVDWTNFDTSNSGLPTPQITSLATEGNIVWMGTSSNLNSSGAGLVSFDGLIWTIYDSTNTPMLSNSISSISIDNHNNKWVGGVSGQVLKFNNNTWTVFNNIYNSQWGFDIKNFDFNNDTVWLATGAGVSNFFGNSTWEHYNTLNSDLPSMTVFTIKNENYIKWIGTWNGLAKVTGTEWTIYNSANSILPHNGIISLAIESNGTKWIGTYGGGLVKFDGTTMTVFNTSNSDIPNNFIRTIQIDKNSNKWIGTNKGVAVFNENGVNLSNDGLVNDKQFVKVSPNPFYNETHIEFSNPDDLRYNLTIFNMTGQVVENIYNIVGNKVKIERKNLNRGIYLYQLSSEKGLAGQGKLIVY
jgi:ligand-binding sensor domain-containing protein